MSETPNTPETGKAQGTFRRSQATLPGRLADPTYPLNHADTIPSIAPGERDAQRQASNRAWAAMMLAQTPEAWFALLRGEPIPLDQINMAEHNRAKRRLGAA